MESESSETTERTHKLTMAERELEHVKEKSESGDALDPLALEDPTGKSVERVVLRAGIVIVLVFVVGILFAQVACRNMRISSVPDFTDGISQEQIEEALTRGVMWGGQVVAFSSDAEFTSLDRETGSLVVTVSDSSSRSIEQVLANAEGPAMALAMNVFENPDMQVVTVVLDAHVSQDTGKFTGSSSDPMGEVMRITWMRDSESGTDQFGCQVSGYDPLMTIAAGSDRAIEASKTVNA